MTQLAFISLLLLSNSCSAWTPSRNSYRSTRLDQHSGHGDATSFKTHFEDNLAGIGCKNRRWLVVSAVTSALLPMIPTPVAAAATSSSSATTKALSEDYRQGTAALADMDDQAPVPREAYQKLPSGVIYADLRPGNSSDNNNNEAKSGSRCNLQWVLRKSNGYFVDSSQVQGDVPFIFVVGDGTAIAGVDEGIRGMKEGGVRRLLIPPSLAYVQGLEDGLPGPLPRGFGPRQQMRRVQNLRKDVPGEYVYLEVQLTRLR